METNNDKMLKTFFAENKKEISDFGFSHRVMRKLPEQTDRSWIVWIFTSMGIVLTLLLGFQTGIISHIFRLLQIIPQIFILIGVLGFSIVAGIAVLFGQRKNFRIV